MKSSLIALVFLSPAFRQVFLTCKTSPFFVVISFLVTNHQSKQGLNNTLPFGHSISNKGLSRVMGVL